jgi:hypothetical protein
VYIGKFDTTVLNVILNSPDVEAVTEDGIASISSTQYVAMYSVCAETSLFTGTKLLGVCIALVIANPYRKNQTQSESKLP